MSWSSRSEAAFVRPSAMKWRAILVATCLAVAGWRRRWVTEDAFINFRVVAVTRHGRQPFAFNPGERVEAATSPLWLATLVVLDGTSGLEIVNLTDAAGNTAMPVGGVKTGFGGTAKPLNHRALAYARQASRA